MSCDDERYTVIRTSPITIAAISQNNRLDQFGSVIDRQRFQRRDHELSIPPSSSRGVSVLARGGDQLRAKFENAHEIAGIYPVGRFSPLEEAVLADEMNDQPRPTQPVPRPQISDPPVNARELRFRTVPAIVR
jgi:hypothetical protein